MQCEMQSVSSRIWTRVAVSISYDDNHYTTGTSPKGDRDTNRGSRAWNGLKRLEKRQEELEIRGSFYADSVMNGLNT